MFSMYTLDSVLSLRGYFLGIGKTGFVIEKNGGTNNGIVMVVGCKAQKKSRMKVRLHDVREYERASCETISSQCERLGE